MSQLCPGTGWPERQVWQDPWVSPRKSLKAPSTQGREPAPCRSGSSCMGSCKAEPGPRAVCGLRARSEGPGANASPGCGELQWAKD